MSPDDYAAMTDDERMAALAEVLVDVDERLAAEDAATAHPA